MSDMEGPRQPDAVPTSASVPAASPTTSIAGDEAVRLAVAYRDHPRRFESFRYVYPVISRRSRGLSIGINLNPDQRCNFHCVYCCVNRADTGDHAGGESSPRGGAVDPVVLHDELRAMLAMIGGGAIWSHPRFQAVPPSHRVLRDIAFSGDGEPTLSPRFGEAVELVVQARRDWRDGRFHPDPPADIPPPKLVLITNATALHHPDARAAIDRLCGNADSPTDSAPDSDTDSALDSAPDSDAGPRGEVWAKLDAGSAGYYQTINVSGVPLGRVLDNITDLARARPIVIQTMVCRWEGEAMPESERAAYAARLRDILDAGGRIDRVQLYTVARRVADPRVAAVSDAELDAMAQRWRADLPSLRFECFYAA